MEKMDLALRKFVLTPMRRVTRWLRREPEISDPEMALPDKHEYVNTG